MDLVAIVNPGDIGGIPTANASNSYPPVMDALPATQIQRRARQRSEKPSAAQRHQQRTATAKQRKRPADTHRVRGGATPTMPHTVSPARMDATSSRHRRYRQPQSPAPDRPLGTPASPRHARSAPLPPSSPARDLLRRAQQSAAAHADALGRRPFIMDVILGGRPTVSQYSEDVIMEAIELSRDALRPTAGPTVLAGEHSLELREGGEGHAEISSTAAFSKTPYAQRTNAEYQVSAERTTAGWPLDDPPLSGFRSPPNQILFSSTGTPQHM